MANGVVIDRGQVQQGYSYWVIAPILMFIALFIALILLPPLAYGYTYPSLGTDTQVQWRGVTKTYQMGEVQVHALRGMDMDVQEGEFLVVVGPSGSGKTTTLNLIGGLDSPTSGALIVAGTDVTDYDEKTLTVYRRDKIGFIFQFFDLDT